IVTLTSSLYTLSLHDALPIWTCQEMLLFKLALFPNILASFPERKDKSPRKKDNAFTYQHFPRPQRFPFPVHNIRFEPPTSSSLRSEEHTSELQSQSNLVCRLL